MWASYVNICIMYAPMRATFGQVVLKNVHFNKARVQRQGTVEKHHLYVLNVSTLH